MDTTTETVIRFVTAAKDLRPVIQHHLRKAGYNGEFRVIKCETLGPVGLFAYAYRATIELAAR